jgi:hypothetical protein
MPLTKVTSGVRTLGTGEVATANMAVDPTNASNLSSGSVPAAQLGNVNTSGLRNDIATLALHSAIADNKAAHNLSNAFIDQFEDSTGIDVATDASVDPALECVTSTTASLGNDSNTIFLLPSNTTNGSTTFVDSSAGGSTHVITATGNTQHVTAQKKFGTSSIYYDGTGDYLTVPDHSDFDHGTDSFTYESWVRVASGGSVMMFFEHDTISNNLEQYAQFQARESNCYYAEYHGGGGTYGAYGQFGSGLTADTWHHVAWVKVGNGLSCYLDGVAQTIAGSYTTTNSSTSLQVQADRRNWTQPLSFGGRSGHGGNWSYHAGWQDCIRISDIARYSSNFTPQGTPGFGIPINNAAGNYTSTTQTALSSVSSVGIVVLYKENVGSTVLNTDLVAQVSANGGTNYSNATLVAGGTFSTGIKIASVSGVSVTAGTAPKYKISFANQVLDSKETQVHGVALLY